MRLKFKGGVHLLLLSLSPQVSWILQVAMHTALPMIDNTVVVTSGADGTHSSNSRHYPGLAFDLRYMGDREGGIDVARIHPPSLVPLGAEDMAHAQREQAKIWAKFMAQVLGTDYDVVVESTHIHVEWDG